jgi:CMP-2-keto-3-deoxyoctulosonic acid synthetase
MVRDVKLRGPVAARTFFHHLGVYVYRASFLAAFAQLPQGRLEQLEQLEQLRALEHGHRIRMVEVAEETIEVNTPEDLIKAESHWQRLHAGTVKTN